VCWLSLRLLLSFDLFYRAATDFGLVADGYKKGITKDKRIRSWKLLKLNDLLPQPATYNYHLTLTRDL